MRLDKPTRVHRISMVLKTYAAFDLVELAEAFTHQEIPETAVGGQDRSSFPTAAGEPIDIQTGSSAKMQNPRNLPRK